jgi:glycosyltransferase involved in cell wall biosynthesis
VKIAYLLSSLSRINGGISESVRRLAQSLPVPAGAAASVLGLRDAYSDADLALWNPLRPQVFPVRGPRAIGYAPALASALADVNADVTHAAGLWMYPSVAHHRWVRRSRRPCVISPHGMLDAWALRNSAWKKRLAGALFERAHLEQAACLHALCAPEAEAIRAYGLTNPICVIPNGIDLPVLSEPPSPPAWAGRIPSGRNVLLFLGRLHPKKGLRSLLQAWARARTPAWHLVIAGWDQGGHERELQALAEAHQLREHVCFCGPLHGPDKAAAYAAAQAFILPSFSEGLPMTILEAWAYGLPVLMTTACNLPEGFQANAALKISTDPGMLAQEISRFLDWPVEERAAMGRRGHDLVARQFSWNRIAGEFLSLYRWIAGQGPQPVCVLP